MGVVRKKWTDDETQMLKELCLTTSNQDLALIFDVTSSMIANKLRKIRSIDGTSMTRCVGTTRQWAEEEEQLLKAQYLVSANEDLAKLLNRSLSSIENKIHVLQLVRPRPGWDGRRKTPETFRVEVASLVPGLVLIDQYTDSKTRIRVKSTTCGHKWDISPNAFLQGIAGRKCPVCLPGTVKPPEVFEAEARELAPDLELLEKYVNTKTSIKVRGVECGHEWEINPHHFLDTHNPSGRKCPVCLPGTVKPPEVFEAEARELAPDLELLEKYVNSNTRIRVKSKICAHEWEILPNSFLLRKRGVRCPTCLPGSSKPPEIFEAEVASLAPDLVLLDKYIHNKTRIRVKSTVCGHEWEIQPNGFLCSGYNRTCPICNPKGTLKAEIDLGDFLAKYTEVIRGDRKLLGGKEIDIYLPGYNLGIEYNGIYWHNENHKHKDYHLEKTELAASKGITLIQVFEHEDIAIVKSRLLSLIGKTYTLGARKTEVKVIDFPKDFLNQNHIQGAGSPSKVNLGLFIREELVATMTFSKPRFNANYEWELIRYCSLLYVTVVGGASKLLKYFIKNYSPESIISYSDKRWSTGKLYTSLGFEHLQTSTPGYFYQKSEVVISRYRAQKHKLKDLVPEFYDETLTEKEIMNSAGWFRVYDCGQDVWVLTL